MTQPIVVAALYKFVTLEDYVALREPLLQAMVDNGIKGTLLIAEEGINGTVSGSREGIDGLMAWLKNDPRMVDIDHKESYCDDQPFYRTKVKLKKEIVTLGVEGVDPNKKVGTYVDPKDWNALISDPEVLLIDTRNDYEVSIGTFEGAIDPKTTSFREFPDYIKANFDPAKHKKVAMFCTGGIRCEKASSYMLSEGFDEVYHLKGGILKYLERSASGRDQMAGRLLCFRQSRDRAPRPERRRLRSMSCLSHTGEAWKTVHPSTTWPASVARIAADKLPEKTRRSAIDRQKQIELAKARNMPHPIGFNYKQTPSEV